MVLAVSVVNAIYLTVLFHMEELSIDIIQQTIVYVNFI